MLESRHIDPCENCVFNKIILAIILILNHSFLFGAIQAAEMPDECHPFGHSMPADHSRLMTPEQHAQLHQYDTDPHAAENCLTHHVDHDGHHEHGMHIHLSLSLPETIDITVARQQSLALPPYLLAHKNLSYIPPVPPPTA